MEKEEYLVYTSEVLFEGDEKILLMCRMTNDKDDQCRIEWIDEQRNETDLIISPLDLNEGMNLFICQICCSNQCEQFNSFVYSVR